MHLPIKYEALQSTHIAQLPRTDPKTCARYYDHKTTSFCKLIKKHNSTLGNVLDFFFVIDFRNRGSKHNHGVLWIKNASNY